MLEFLLKCELLLLVESVEFLKTMKMNKVVVVVVLVVVEELIVVVAEDWLEEGCRSAFAKWW